MVERATLPVAASGPSDEVDRDRSALFVISSEAVYVRTSSSAYRFRAVVSSEYDGRHVRPNQCATFFSHTPWG